MEIESKIRYSSLSEKEKLDIKKNISRYKDLKKGFYSEVFSIIINNKKELYRFQKREINGQKKTFVFFNSNQKSHKPHKKDNQILFYDKDLKVTLKIKRELVEEELEKPNEYINFNLSTEQKELLLMGHDVSLQVFSNSTKIQTSNPRRNVIISKTNYKGLKKFVADYDFFLGKTSLFVKYKEVKSLKKTY